MVQEKHYLLPLSNNISNKNIQQPIHEGMNRQQLPFTPPSSSSSLPVDTHEQSSTGFDKTCENVHETVPHHQHSLKEMGENEISHFENMIGSLSPEKKQSLIYSILQHQFQDQNQIVSMLMEELPLPTTSTDVNNLASSSPPLSSSLDSNNLMMMNSESNHHHHSNVLLMSNNSNNSNGNRGAEFQSITPLEELWFRSMNNCSSSPPINYNNNYNNNWMFDGSSGKVSCSLPNNYQIGGGLIFSNIDDNEPQQQQFNNRHHYEHNNIKQQQEEYMMIGKSFPPSNASSVHLQKLMQVYHQQKQQELNQQQAPWTNNQIILGGAVGEQHNIVNTLNKSQLLPNPTTTNCNEKANPEKGLLANEAHLGFDIAPSQNITSTTYQRGSSSLLSQHLKDSMSNNGTTTCLNESFTNNVHGGVQHGCIVGGTRDANGSSLLLASNLPREKLMNQQQPPIFSQTHLPQYENMVTDLIQHQLSSSPSTTPPSGHEFNATTSRTMDCVGNESFSFNNKSTGELIIPSCQPYVSSFSSFTKVARPTKDAEANLSKSNSGPNNVPNNKKETQPPSFFTSSNTIIGAVSTRISNSPPILTPSSSLASSALITGDSKIYNSNTLNSSNVPSINSSQLISSSSVGSTTNIQQEQQQNNLSGLHLNRNSQQEEQSYNNITTSGNSQINRNPPHHAAVMNNNPSLPTSNSTSYQQTSPTSSQIQHQQNYLLPQQHLHQSLPQNNLQQSSFINGASVMNGFPNYQPNNLQTSGHIDAPQQPSSTFTSQQQQFQTMRSSTRESQAKESDDEPYLPKQFSVLPPSSKRRMKRKTDQTSRSTTVANVPSNTISSLNSTLLKKMTVDMYYDITSAGHPFLPREDLENLSVNDDQRTNLAFMFSLQTLCYQRFGLTKQAHDSFEKAKNLVLFNPSDPNLFNTACTYVNLALYCNSSGDPENANKFSRILDYNILRDDSFRDSQNPEQLKALTQMKKISDISGGSGYYGDDRGLNDVSKFILSIYQYSTGGERPVPTEMMQIARQPLNMDTLPEYLSLLDCVMKMMLIYESKGLHFSESQKKMTKYLYYGLSYGMKILLLKLCGFKGPELEEAAEKITLLCRTPTFTFAPTFLIQPVGLALDVHCEMLKEIDQGERSNVEEFKIAKLLRNDIESLRFLTSRYPELCANFNPSLDLAESLLEKKGRSLSRFLDADIYSSNSGGVTIIEDELKVIEGQIKESAKTKRKSREDESTNDNFGNTPNTTTSTDLNSNPHNMQPPNSFIPIISEEFPKNYGFDPLAFLSEEDYELLFGEDQKSVTTDYY
ncbi:predicted protein [Naegleria gruberi]|uniref:Predicted protein n=1 Tax=Naegleria gruberi TaxID=5762 RepID=D2VTU8_NAEGR|nr:uncharacterized protein NAEGRDRAFT_59203 [Naegleria gruberi]EFC39715.1 predicted protein [Naegleria gruberi]|eukprot:XP_002672459.1 predicted protein [Naegleria gruberi strain NEG-M]